MCLHTVLSGLAVEPWSWLQAGLVCLCALGSMAWGGGLRVEVGSGQDDCLEPAAVQALLAPALSISVALGQVAIPWASTGCACHGTGGIWGHEVVR